MKFTTWEDGYEWGHSEVVKRVDSFSKTIYSARMRVIEGILIDRMGYKPKRVDDKLLVSLKAKIENN